VDLSPAVIGIEHPRPKHGHVLSGVSSGQVLSRHDLGHEATVLVPIVVLVQEAGVAGVGLHHDVVVAVGLVPNEKDHPSVGLAGAKDVKTVRMVDTSKGRRRT